MGSVTHQHKGGTFRQPPHTACNCGMVEHCLLQHTPCVMLMGQHPGPEPPPQRSRIACTLHALQNSACLSMAKA